jgi:hypothetical protein
MRNPGFAPRLISRADPVPHHMGDDGCSMIGNDHDLQTVLQCKGLYINVKGERGVRPKHDEEQKEQRSGQRPTESRCEHMEASNTAYVSHGLFPGGRQREVIGQETSGRDMTGKLNSF